MTHIVNGSIPQSRSSANELPKIGERYLYRELTKFTQVPHSLITDRTLPRSAIFLWAMIREHQQDTGECRVSERVLARECGVNKRNLRRLSDTLVKRGYIKAERHQGKTTRRYTLRHQRLLVHIPGQADPGSVSQTEDIRDLLTIVNTEVTEDLSRGHGRPQMRSQMTSPILTKDSLKDSLKESFSPTPPSYEKNSRSASILKDPPEQNSNAARGAPNGLAAGAAMTNTSTLARTPGKGAHKARPEDAPSRQDTSEHYLESLRTRYQIACGASAPPRHFLMMLADALPEGKNDLDRFFRYMQAKIDANQGRHTPEMWIKAAVEFPWDAGEKD